MNIQETKECIRVMQAFVDGKELISMRTPAVTDDPYWNWGNHTKMYHIKPTATLRPWTPDEVPLGAWVRMKNLNMKGSMIVSVAAFNLGIAFKEYEHSIDNGKTWHPCGVMEESK